MTLRLNPKKRKSFDSVYINDDDMSSLEQRNRAQSQTSLLFDSCSAPVDAKPAMFSFDNQGSQQRTAATKQTQAHKYIPKFLTNQVKDGKFVKAYNNVPHKIDINPRLVKSASSSDLLLFQTSDDVSSIYDDIPIDMVDGPFNNQTGKWDANKVDIKKTETMLQTLDLYIKEAKQKIFKDESQKEECVNKLISNLTPKDNDKYSKKFIHEFGTKNKNAEKLLEKTKSDLEQLEYKRLIVNKEGIPLGISSANYVKSINKKLRNKKAIDKESQKSFNYGLLEGHSLKSASAENINKLVSKKTSESADWHDKTDKKKQIKDDAKKILFLDDSRKRINHVEESFLSKSTSNFQSNNKHNSIGTNSVSSDKGIQMKISKPNSLASGVGREPIYFNLGDNQSQRRSSCSTLGVSDLVKSDDKSLAGLQSIQADLNNIKKDIQDIRSEGHKLQYDNDNLKLDMKTDSELNFQKMQNSIERIDRVEINLDDLQKQCQIEFLTWKDRSRKLEEILDYRLTMAKRDLQDNIDACSNRIGLVDNKTEQLPFMKNRTGDVKVIGDQLFNLMVSLFAFFILLISTGLNFMIKLLNISTSISQRKGFLFFILAVIGIIVIVALKWPLPMFTSS